MPYSSDGRRSNVPRRSQGRAGDSRSSQGRITSSGKRPARARGGSPSQYRNARTLQGGDYNLRSHNIRFNNRRGGLLSEASRNPRVLLVLVAFVILLVICVFGITTCVRGCMAQREQEAQTSEQDARVVAGLSEDMTNQFIEALDRGEAIARIAAGADKIEDERLLTLALTEPTAVDFVAGFVDGTTPGASRYDSEVSRGVYPLIYNWDTRWGYVTYGSGVMGITGSGPTTMAMAYMGLLGKNDLSPADFATMATEASQTSETYDTNARFFFDNAEKLGLEAEDYTPSGETLNDVIDSGVVVAVQLKEGTFGSHGHWALVVSENLDGSVNIYDPTSTANTQRPWDPDTVAGNSETFVALSRAPEETTEGE